MGTRGRSPSFSTTLIVCIGITPLSYFTVVVLFAISGNSTEGGASDGVTRLLVCAGSSIGTSGCCGG